MLSHTPRLACLIVLVLAPAARAADWPTFMHDNQRGGVTADRVVVPLVQQWVWQSSVEPKPAWPPPQPGWTELPKVQFDDAFYAVADAHQVYFGSSVDNQVYALDARTGVIRWRFFTGGPVRLAPTLACDRVYFGSDDGQVYALKRDDGTPAWTFNAALNPRQVLGNGRPISLWPVRTSVLVEGDRVYCGAGVFPYHRDGMLALEADSGKLVWKNDAVGATGGFSPQGYLLACQDGLIVPSGRAPPVCLDRASGQLAYNVPAAGNKGEVGGSYGVVIHDVLFVGTQSTLHGFKGGKNVSRWLTAEQVIATPESYIVLKGPTPPAYGRKPVTGKGDDITAYDRAACDSLKGKDAASVARTQRWRYARPNLEAVIAAGPHVIAGGDNEVIVLDAATGKELWVGKVAGRAVGLAVAHGRLIVSTTSGAIHCFANDVPPKVANVTVESDWPAKPSREEIDAIAQAVRREAGALKGYALLTGPGADRLACQLAKGSELTITCIELDPRGLAASRQRVAAAGMYGRVTVEAGTAEALLYPDFAANLVVHLDQNVAGKESLRVLKPCGGVLLTRGPATAEWKAAGPSTSVSGFTKLERDSLPGSGWWTHQYGDAGGSGSSGDQRVKGPLDVLWFGEPGANEFADRHQRAMAPLLMNGRVFCQGWNFLDRQTTVFCFDAYNGVRCWKRELKGSVRLNLPAVSGNLACDTYSVFVAGGSECHRLDAISGETRAVYQTPAERDGSRRDWAFLAVADGLLFGSAASRSGFSTKLFAFDVASGKLRWQADRPEIRDTTLVVSNGRVLFVEKRPIAAKPAADTPPKLDRRGEPIPPGTNRRTVMALDAATGKSLWEKQVDLTDCGRWENGTWGLLQALCKDDVLVLAGAYTIYGRREDLTPRQAMALSAKDGMVLWTSVVENRSRPIVMQGALLAEPLFYDLHKGTKILKPQGNRMIPWTMGPRTGGCGPLSASDCMVFGRGGYTVWRNVAGGPSGTFVGTRPGCAINIIPAGGVVVQAEASSGCSCYQAVQCTVVFRPRE